MNFTLHPTTSRLSGKWLTLEAASLDSRGGGFQFLGYLPAGTAVMDAKDHRYVIAELDALGRQVADMIRRFEVAGVTAIMKDDYVALHTLEHRIMEMRLAHACKIDAK